MIGIKIIKKPKATSTTSGGTGIATSYTQYAPTSVKEAAHAKEADTAKEATHALSADTATTADEATHAVAADEATHAASAAALDADSPTRDDFISAINPDEAAEVITFLKGLISKQMIKAEGGITLDGDMTSSLFDALAETGLGLTKDTAGNWSLFLKNITVWGKAIFRELEIRRLSYVGGDFIFSPAGCTIDRVVAVDAAGVELTADDTTAAAAYRCYFVADDGTTATTNSFALYDQALCQTFNIREGVYQNVANRYYWRLVTAVGDGYVDLSATDCEDKETNDIPQKGDVLVCVGNRYDTARQNVIKISTQGDDAPAIQMFHGVNDYHLGAYTDTSGVEHTNRTAIISPALVEISADIFKLISGGQTQTIKDYIDENVPIVVSLTSDSHLFAGDTEKATAQSYSFGVQATRGTEAVNCNVVSVSGAPSGMEVSIGSVVKDSEGVTLVDSEGVTLRDGDGEITITLDGTMTETAGTLDVEIECEGVTYHKLFSWGVALVGKQGEQGIQGDTGAAGADAISIRVTNNATALQGVEVESTEVTMIDDVPYLAVTTETKVLALGLFKGATQIGVTAGKNLVTWEFTSDDIKNIGSPTLSLMNIGQVLLNTSSLVRATADTENNIYLPITNPTILAKATYGGVTYQLALPVTIDYTARWSSLTQTNKEILQQVKRVQTNINLIEDIPQPTFTQEDFTKLFTDITVNGVAVADPQVLDGKPYFARVLLNWTGQTENIYVAQFKCVAASDDLTFTRPYASYIDDDTYPKAGNKLYLTIRYKASGSFDLYAGINDTFDATTLNPKDSAKDWHTATIEVPTIEAEGDSSDYLCVSIEGHTADTSLYISGMTLLREGGSIVSTMGYVDVKADEVKLGVKTDLRETGISIDDGLILLKSDNVRAVNSKDEQIAIMDDEGNILAHTFTAEDTETGLQTTINSTGLHLTSSKSKSSIHTGVDENGAPFIYGTDANGNIVWRLGASGIGGADSTFAITPDYSQTVSADTVTQSGTQYVHTYRAVAYFTLTNKSQSIQYIDAGDLKIAVPKQFANGVQTATNATAITLEAGASTDITLTTSETATMGIATPIISSVSISIYVGTDVIGSIETNVATSDDIE